MRPDKDGLSKTPGGSFGAMGVTQRLPARLLLLLDVFELGLQSETDLCKANYNVE